MRFPDFIIIGAAKSGTTSLYHYLQQHPQVCMAAIKEPRFFAFEGVDLNQFTGPQDAYMLRRTGTITELEIYLRLFEDLPEDVRAGEASPAYLYFAEWASTRMRHYVPDVKLIAILRDPVERAYSHYLHMRREGHELLETFEEALAAESGRKAAGWGPRWFYAAHSCYASQLRPFLDTFSEAQIRVFLYDDFKQDPLGVMGDVFTFLQVDPGFEPDVSLRYNRSGVPRYPRLHRFISHHGLVRDMFRHWTSRRLRVIVKNRYLERGLVQRAMSPATRASLQERFRNDILLLQDLLHRDLSMWLA